MQGEILAPLEAQLERVAPSVVARVVDLFVVDKLPEGLVAVTEFGVRHLLAVPHLVDAEKLHREVPQPLPELLIPEQGSAE